MRFAHADTNALMQRGTERLKALLPAVTHQKIEQYREQHNWINAENYR
jgi:hypothetical protein